MNCKAGRRRRVKKAAGAMMNTPLFERVHMHHQDAINAMQTWRGPGDDNILQCSTSPLYFDLLAYQLVLLHGLIRININ